MAFVWKTFQDLVVYGTDEEYADSIHLPHSAISVARYRKWREEEGEPRNWLYDLVASYWMSSQGGGCINSALVDGLPAMGHSSAKHMHFHTLCYVLNYWCPGDLFYKALSQPRHPLRVAFTFMDSVDAVCTVYGYVDDGVTRFPKNPMLPFMQAILLYNIGSVYKWFDYKGRGKAKDNPHFLTKPSTNISRAIAVTAAYWVVGLKFRSGRYRKTVLALVAAFFGTLEVAEDWGDFDAFESAHKPLARVLEYLRVRLSLGPTDTKPKELQ